jgi:hypothetical protein
LSLISTLSFSQQVLKRITETPTTTKIELYVLRNGTNNSNIVGESNYDVGSSSSSGTINFRNTSGTITYNSTINSNGTFPTFPNDIICNKTIESSTGVRSTRSNFTDTSNSSNILNISVIRQDKNADILEDLNSLVDVLYSSFEIPKLMDNGNNIPLNTWVILRSRSGVDLATGGDAPYQKRIGFQFNGTTWIQQDTDWLNVGFDNLENVCNSLNVVEISKNKVSFYPNPVDNLITIQSSDNLKENYEYQIFDLIGRIVKIDNSKFNEQLNIGDLKSGNYIIKIKTENGEIHNHTLIKK